MENAAHKSIWLRRLGVEMLNAGNTPVANACRYMSRLFGADTVLLYLSEAGDEGRKAILISKGRASMYSLESEDDDRFSGILGKVIASGEILTAEGMRAVPMSCSRADHFGALIFVTNDSQPHTQQNIQLNTRPNTLPNTQQNTHPDERYDSSPDFQKQEAVNSFSELIYAELMGGFMLSDNEPVMEVRDVCVRYGSEKDARNTVDNVCFDINAGELTVIMGKSGCGKSTLLNVMAGILSPQSGEVLWHGENICAMNDRKKTAFRRDTIGYIFQNYNLISELTAGENVAVAAALSKNAMQVTDALALVGLSDKKNQYPRRMSGGEQQRVSIARALVKNASLLLCDEPTGALDTANAKLVMSLLQRIAKQRKIPVVVVTHNPDYAILADHYILIQDGKVEDEFYRHFPYSAEKVL